MIVDGERLTNSEVRKLIKFFDHECREMAALLRAMPQGSARRCRPLREVPRVLVRGRLSLWRRSAALLCGKPLPEFRRGRERELLAAGAASRARQGQGADPQGALCPEILGANSQHTPVQLNKDSQQFAGDRFEVKQIATTYATTPSRRCPEAFEHNRNQALR